MRTLFCLFGANGSGKTTIVKSLIEKHWSGAVSLGGWGELWNLVSIPNGKKILVVGRYGASKICGIDRLGVGRMISALYSAIRCEDADSFIIEGWKLSKPEVHKGISDFCRNNRGERLRLYSILVTPGPLTCYSRQKQREVKGATYSLAIIQKRASTAYALYNSLRIDKKSAISTLGQPGVAVARLLRILQEHK